MFLPLLCLCLSFHAIEAQVKAQKCIDKEDAACAARDALTEDVSPADGIAVELLQRTGRKVMEEGSLDDLAHDDKGKGHTKHSDVKDSGDLSGIKVPKAAKAAVSPGFSNSTATDMKALQEDDSARNTFFNRVLFQIMTNWIGFKFQLHRFIARCLMHINRYVMIAAITICLIFRFSLLYAPTWIYEALLPKKESAKKDNTNKMPFSDYPGRALHFTTPPAEPTMLYTTSRNWGQGTVLRASLWFTVLVPLILVLWIVVSSTSMHRVLSLGLANIGIFQIGLTALYNFLAPWPAKDTEHKNNPEYLKKIGCIVPCHQSADEIATTVRSLLQFFEPEHIVVVDNGNSVKPLDDTANRLQELEPRVNYMWVPIGMKTNALWMGLNRLPSSVEYVMHIDDDTELPEDMIFDEEVWEHEKTDAISYGINMYQTGWVEKFVDFEFKQFSQMRLFQSNMSTVWFQHGIIGIWRRPAFTEVLKEHPFLPFGEDNWNGTINLLKNRQMRQELRSCVKTYAPATLLPVTGSRQQGYGAANIWKQRADRWFVNAPRRFWIRFYLMLFYRADSWRSTLVFKIISLEHLVGIIAHLCMPLSLIACVVDAFSGHGYAGHVVAASGYAGALKTAACAFLPLFCCSMFDSLFQNYVCWHHRPDIQVDLKTCLLYPFYQTFLMICCWYGHWRCLFWYIPFVPMRHGLYTEGGMTADLLKQIHKIDTAPALVDELSATKGLIKAEAAAAPKLANCDPDSINNAPADYLVKSSSSKGLLKDDADAAAGAAKGKAKSPAKSANK